MANIIIKKLKQNINSGTHFVAFRSKNFSSLVSVSAMSQPADFVPVLAPCFSGSHYVHTEGDTVFVDFI